MPSGAPTARHLSALAQRLAHEHLSRELDEALTVNVAHESLTWDEEALAYVFEQRVLAHRRLAPFDVILDERGHVCGFVDHAKRANAQPDVRLERSEIEAILRITPLIPRELSVRDVERFAHGGGELLRVHLTVRSSGRESRAMIAELNPATRALISLIPADMSAP